MQTQIQDLYRNTHRLSSHFLLGVWADLNLKFIYYSKSCQSDYHLFLQNPWLNYGCCGKRQFDKGSSAVILQSVCLDQAEPIHKQPA